MAATSAIPGGDRARHHQLGPDELATGAEQPLQQGGRRRERRVRDDEERLAGQPQVGGVGLHHLHRRATESCPQCGCAARMELDRDHPRPGSSEVVRDGAGAGPDVEDEVTGLNLRVRDESLRPPVSELVPPPPRRCRGHGPSP